MTNLPPPGRRALRALRPLSAVALVVATGVGLVATASWLGNRVGSRLAENQETASASVEPGVDIEVEIPAGSNAGEIAEMLESSGVVRSAVQFEAAVRAAGVDASLRAGTYELVTGMTPEEVIEVLRRGPLVRVFEVTVIEGLRIGEVIDRLAVASGIPVDEFENALTEGVVTTRLRVMPDSPALTDWEGLLFPDTYRFSENATAADMLSRLARTMEDRMDSIDWSEFEAAGFDLYQGIIIASLIESEVRVAEERPLVSSVIRNRLAEPQRLEIDASVLYGLGTRDPADFDREADTPYNTYANDGLPPTPIAAPGLASLEAAAQPAESEFKYYVLSAEDGSHTFSVTFEEHQAAVAKARADGILP